MMAVKGNEPFFQVATFEVCMNNVGNYRPEKTMAAADLPVNSKKIVKHFAKKQLRNTAVPGFPVALPANIV